MLPVPTVQWTSALLTHGSGIANLFDVASPLSAVALCRPPTAPFADLFPAAECPRLVLPNSNAMVLPAAMSNPIGASIEPLALLPQQRFKVPQINLVPAGCVYFAANKVVSRELPDDFVLENRLIIVPIDNTVI
jgi:hypothetical protein